jgi:hypothetical protein
MEAALTISLKTQARRTQWAVASWRAFRQENDMVVAAATAYTR